jgi:ketosteroid isomerase-like protein
MSSRSRRVLLFLCLLVLPTGSAPAQGKADPKADRDAEGQRIRELDRRWMAAVERKDSAAIAEFYAPGGRIMPSNAPTAEGHAAIAEFWKRLLALPAIAFTFRPERVKVAEAGDMAYDFGTYSLSYDGPQGRVRDKGKYLVVWEKINGDWKAIVDIDNSDLAEP